MNPQSENAIYNTIFALVIELITLLEFMYVQTQVGCCGIYGLDSKTHFFVSSNNSTYSW